MGVCVEQVVEELRAMASKGLLSVLGLVTGDGGVVWTSYAGLGDLNSIGSDIRSARSGRSGT